jgi:hypothetical protein
VVVVKLTEKHDKTMKLMTEHTHQHKEYITLCTPIY